MGENDIDLLRRRSNTAKNKIYNIIGLLQALVDDPETTANALQLQLDLLHQSLQKYNNNHDDITDLVTEGETLTQEVQSWSKVNQDVIAAKDKIDRAIKTIGSTTLAIGEGTEVTRRSQHQHQQDKSRLPKISLPKFAGNKLEFPSFWDRFNAMVHSRSDIDPCEKFTHLLGALEDQALRTLDGYSVTNANYPLAVEALKKRFYKPQLSVETHVLALVDCAQQNRADANSIRQLHDTFEMHLKGLAALKKDPQTGELSADDFLVPILKRKLPPLTRRRWQNKLNKEGDENPTIAEFIEFLHKELDTEEALTHEQKSEEKSTNKEGEKTWVKFKPTKPSPLSGSSQSSPFGKPVTALLSAEAITAQKCPFCGDKMHENIRKCKKVLQFSVLERREIANKSHLCYNCMLSGHAATNCKLSSCGIDGCTTRHHKFLHCEQRTNTTETVGKPLSGKFSSGDTTCESTGKSVSSNWSTGSSTNVQLQVALATLVAPDGHVTTVTVLFDPGSQSSFIRKALSEDLGLNGPAEEIVLATIGNTAKVQHTKRVSFALKPLRIPGDATRVRALAINPMSDTVDIGYMKPNQYKHLHNIPLAYHYTKPRVPLDVVIGADHCWDFYTGSIRSGSNPQEPVAVESTLGWVLSGNSPNSGVQDQNKVSVTFAAESEIEHPYVKSFWEDEVLGLCQTVKEEKSDINEKQDPILKYFEDTIQYDGERYHVRIPWKQGTDSIPNNYIVAKNRLKQIEVQNKRNGKSEAYARAMDEYFQMGFSEEVKPGMPLSSRTWYLPHHGVFCEERETTKTRVVFDGSSKFMGVSINQCIHQGPTLQPDLLGILLRFRENPVALLADIKKMFLQIGVQEEDRDATRYLWRDPNGTIRTYRFMRVCFGLNVSPFLAIATVQHHVQTNAKNFPKLSKQVIKNTYVDDLVDGQNDIYSASEFVNDAIDLMRLGGFELVKWASNEPQALQIPEGLKASVMSKPGCEKVSKVLGVKWDLHKDTLGISSCPTPTDVVTKRSILKTLAEIFDPFGFIAPFQLQGKILFQELWARSLDWDVPVPDDILAFWKAWEADLPLLKSVIHPRYVYDRYSSNCKVELHAFGDASFKAYGTVVYLRLICENNVWARFIVAKTKVAPMKKRTMPKLELMAATITAELAHFVKNELKITVHKMYYWSDSEIGLSWIVSEKKKPVFVTNRVTQIRKVTTADEWFHCPGHLNPADKLSRGMNLAKLLRDKSWIDGPDWLYTNPLPFETFVYEYAKLSNMSEGIQGDNSVVEYDLETLKPGSKPIFVATNTLRVSPLKTDLRNLLPITAWVLRFIHNCKSQKDHRRLGQLSIEELRDSELTWIRLAQAEAYTEEIATLTAGKPVSKRSSLVKLDPILGDDNLLRVGGRIDRANITLNAKHPIILPRGTPIADRIINRVHIQQLHAGPLHTLASLRETYWLPQGRCVVKSSVHRCPVCRKQAAVSAKQKMGDLPYERVNVSRPFSHIGVDFAGPVALREKDHTTKGYICLFTCMSTRAIHLEVTTDMSVDKFLQAYRRMTARRGKTKTIWSDNAKTFKAANNELQKVHRSLRKENVINGLKKEGITWKFIPERGPWQGGFYERLVRSVKSPLRKILGKALLSYEDFSTVLTEVECHLNSRPLTPVSDNPSDLEALTPAHLLAGYPLMSCDLFAINKVGDSNTSLRQRWNLKQRLSTQCWNRWKKEYLLGLQERNKWMCKERNIRKDDLVLIEEDNLPRGAWLLGRIEEVFKGRDDNVRSATVKTTKGNILRRPIQRFHLLEAFEEA